MLITTGAMKLARRSKRARTSMTAVIVIRPRDDGDVEKAAGDETASGAVGQTYTRTHKYIVVVVL
jgi:hypothetical protein